MFIIFSVNIKEVVLLINFSWYVEYTVYAIFLTILIRMFCDVCNSNHVLLLNTRKGNDSLMKKMIIHQTPDHPICGRQTSPDIQKL